MSKNPFKIINIHIDIIGQYNCSKLHHMTQQINELKHYLKKHTIKYHINPNIKKYDEISFREQ